MNPMPHATVAKDVVPLTRTWFLLIMMFFCGSNLFAQRLSLTDVQAHSVTGPGPGLRIALGGTVNSDMSVSQRDTRDYPQTNINPLFSNQVQFNG
ncbi:MAG: hypothetical protein EBS60_04095, partial [Verrucomicrobia bacterium]|nr:hypothetical protein [Verrucomicrobiota bacterium]